MFKNLIVYRVTKDFSPSLVDVESALSAVCFEPCGATQEMACGFIPPRGEAEGAFVESIGGQWIAKFVIETKTVPGSAIAAKISERCEAIEQREGRTPGKKERREMKAEVLLDLLPYAFVRRKVFTVWLDIKAGLLVLDCGSQSQADTIATVLVNTLPKLALALIDTNTSPQAAMSKWLLDGEATDGFYIDRDCELRSSDESRAVVRYSRHPLNTDEVRQHIEHGKLPTKLAMTWDDRVSFVLTEDLQLKKLSFLDSVLDDTDPDDSGFDTDAAIATGELSRLLPDLIKALGGEGRTAQTV